MKNLCFRSQTSQMERRQRLPVKTTEQPMPSQHTQGSQDYRATNVQSTYSKVVKNTEQLMYRNIFKVVRTTEQLMYSQHTQGSQEYRTANVQSTYSR